MVGLIHSPKVHVFSGGKVALGYAFAAVVCLDASRVSSMANRAKLSSTIAPATTETVRRRPSSTLDRVRAACRHGSG